ncbi:MAG TPA: SIR2 family protein [Thermoguttaceae bacterium]|nr:SIR2 family protein [Thermoguttaceae bacterium]
MENVVYLLGAGFSAPFGLPVMSNFLEKSKDQYYRDPETYSHFLEVIKTIDEMAKIKNYYNTDLHNIEEILSILEMQSLLAGGEKRDLFVRYIVDVIDYHTRKITEVPRGADELFKALFGNDALWQLCGIFAAALLGYRFSRSGNGPLCRIRVTVAQNRETQYSVVTLNYDTVLERIIKFMHVQIDTVTCPSFFRKKFEDGTKDEPNQTPLAKLHGCVEEKNIVPPTWNKVLLKDNNLLSTWRTASGLLSQANYIRIIGYSLPVSDSYIKYLLRSAIMDSRHLKRIDVVCLDPGGDVKQRFDNFICYPKYRFKSDTTENYLSACTSLDGDKYDTYSAQLDPKHDQYMLDG